MKNPRKPSPKRSTSAAHAPKGPPAPRLVPDKPTHWDNVAEWYDTLVGDEGSDYHRNVIFPGVLRMIENDPPKRSGRDHKSLAGLRLLDLACGQGAFCRLAAAQGAATLGIDAAPALIEAARAREKAESLGITYQLADVTKLAPETAPVAGAPFDVITIILAIQNLTPLSPVWHACRELLAPTGRLVVVMMHPCFRVFRKSNWRWNDGGNSQSRTVDEYLTSFKTDIQMKPAQAAAGDKGETTASFHRPLQAYINTLGNANLLIDHLEEWPSHRQPPAGARFDALDKSRKEIPLFLALRARRAG